jgi:predicted nucleic acid-binding protein
LAWGIQETRASAAGQASFTNRTRGDHLVRTRLHQDFVLGILDDITDGVFVVEDLTAEDYVRVRQICSQYADANMGFVDASVLAVVERLNEPKVATLDHRNFRMLRPRHVDALQLLPE